MNMVDDGWYMDGMDCKIYWDIMEIIIIILQMNFDSIYYAWQGGSSYRSWDAVERSKRRGRREKIMDLKHERQIGK